MKFFIKRLDGEVLLKPVHSDVAKKLYQDAYTTGDYYIELVKEVKEKKKNRKLERLYRGSLPVLVSNISDIGKKWTVEEFHIFIKTKFAEFKLADTGEDLFDYYYERDENSNLVKLRQPVSFNNRMDGKLYQEFVNFYKDYCIANYNINPLEDAKERFFMKDRVRAVEEDKKGGW